MNILNDAKNAIRGALSNKKDVAAAIGEQLSKLPYADFDEFCDWITSYVTKSKPYLKDNSVDSYEGLTSSGHIAVDSLDRQVRWTATILGRHSTLLVRFHELARQFERLWLTGDIDAANGALDAIEGETGKSIWLVNARIAFLQQTSGLDTQKNFATSIASEAPRSLASFIAAFASTRNEPSTTLARFRQRISAVIGRQRLSASAKTYLRWQLLDQAPENADDLRDALAYSASVSVIDCYATTLQVLDQAATRVDLMHLWSAIASSLTKSGVNFPDFVPYLELFSGRKIVRPARSNVAADYFWQGMYRQAADASLSALVDDPADASQIWAYAASRALGNFGDSSPNEIPAPLRAAIEPLTTVFQRRGGITQATAELAKLFANLRHLQSVRCLEGYFSRDWIEATPVGVSRATAIFTNSDCVGVEHAIVGPRSVANNILALFSDQDGPAIRVRRSQLEGTQPREEGCPIGQLLEAHAVGLLLNGQSQDALHVVDKIRQHGTEPWIRRASGLVVGALLDSGELGLAIEQIATLASVEDDLRHTLPLERAFGGKRWRDVTPFKKSIALPIALELHQRTLQDREHQSTLRTAYDEFVIANGVDRPSQLKTDAFPRPLMRQFLEKVCLPQVMDVSFRVFKNSRDVIQERINVCGILVTLDADNSKIFEEEIRELTKQIKLQDALQEVDRSRLYVNQDGISRICLAEIDESYSRYHQLRARGLGFSEPGYIEQLINELVEGNAEAFAIMPGGEGDELLVEMVDAVEREYLTNADHGLDAYLSMRVRHGSLAGNVRGPLQSAHLVTTKAADSNEYVKDIHWRARLPGLSPTQIQDMQTALANFSARVDKLLDELIKNRLQVRGTLKPEGVFVLPRVPLFFHVLRSEISAQTTAEQFITQVTETIEYRLASVLKEAQRLVSVDLKAALLEAFDDLRSELEVALPTSAFMQINGAIGQCAPELQAAVERVGHWFRLPSDATANVIATLDWGIDLALAATKSANAGFDPIVERHIDSAIHLESGGISEILDILFIIFGNAAQHSGMGNQPHIKITAGHATGDPDNTRVVRVESEVAEGVYSQEVADRLARIEKAIEAGTYRNQVNREGGTGLLKLRRMIAADPRRTLSFGFASPTLFFTEMRLAMRQRKSAEEVIS